MALSPLQIELIDDTGAPVNGATVELRHELTGAPADGYNRDGSVMAQPFLTDATGAKLIWLPNGIYEWRTSGAFTSEWKPFRAEAPPGAESAPFVRTPAASLDDPMPATATVLDTVAVPSFGVENQIGNMTVTLDFAFNHMVDLRLVLITPSAVQVPLWEGAFTPRVDDFAFDGAVTLKTNAQVVVPSVIVDGGVYGATFADLQGAAPNGDWSVAWNDSANAEPFTGRLGSLRSWSLTFEPYVLAWS